MTYSWPMTAGVKDEISSALSAFNSMPIRVVTPAELDEAMRSNQFYFRANFPSLDCEWVDGEVGFDRKCRYVVKTL